MHSLNIFQTHQPTAAHLVRGFSLIEVMVTVGILAVLAALAGPSFQPLIAKWRVLQTVDNMKSTIYYARSEAIKRGGGIGVEKNPKATAGCAQAATSQAWGCGWFVFVDSNSNGKWNTGEEILQTIAPPINVNVMHTSGSSNIKVDRYGVMSGLNAKGFAFTPEPVEIAPSASRSLCMSSGGRIRVIEEIPC